MSVTGEEVGTLVRYDRVGLSVGWAMVGASVGRRVRTIRVGCSVGA